MQYPAILRPFKQLKSSYSHDIAIAFEPMNYRTALFETGMDRYSDSYRINRNTYIIGLRSDHS